MGNQATTKLALVSPIKGTGQLVDSDVHLKNNWDKIDANIGVFVCTSGTRPSSPFDGQVIYETDTLRTYVRSAALGAWIPREKSVYTTQDATFPKNAADTGAVNGTAGARITIPAAPYPRLVTAKATNRLRYSQAALFEARLYIGTTKINSAPIDPGAGTNVWYLVSLEGSMILPGGSNATERAIELRAFRTAGTGTVDTLTAPVDAAYLEVETEAIGSLAAS